MPVEARTYVWSYVLSWGLTLSGGALAVVSVLAFFTQDFIEDGTARSLCVIAFACIVGFSVACANCTAAAAQHAMSRRFYASIFWPAILCTLGFCVTTSIGVHLGWALMTENVASHALPDARIVNGAAVFIALAKPAMNWIIEGRKSIDQADRQAAEAAEEALLSAIRNSERSAVEGSAQQFRPEVIEGGRSASQAKVTLTVGAANSASHVGVLADQPATGAQRPTLAETQALALLQTGKRQRAVARETGLTRYRVSQLAAERTRASA